MVSAFVFFAGNIAGVIPETVVEQIYEEPVLDTLTKRMRDFAREGYSGDQLLTQLLQVIIADERMEDTKKALLLEKLAVSQNLRIFKVAREKVKI